jgi:hypothetical protein
MAARGHGTGQQRAGEVEPRVSWVRRVDVAVGGRDGCHGTSQARVTIAVAAITRADTRSNVAGVAIPVTTGAGLFCSFGLSPGTLIALPNTTVTENKPTATIFDTKPFVNITPFGLCTSLANPITASQTAAALGVLTPGTCTPVIPAPWVPGSPTVLVGNKPALTNTSQCVCAYGGVITVTMPGATTAVVP